MSSLYLLYHVRLISSYFTCVGLSLEIFSLLRAFWGLSVALQLVGVKQGIYKQYVFESFKKYSWMILSETITCLIKMVDLLFQTEELSQPYADKIEKTLFTWPRFSNLSKNPRLFTHYKTFLNTKVISFIQILDLFFLCFQLILDPKTSRFGQFPHQK